MRPQQEAQTHQVVAQAEYRIGPTPSPQEVAAYEQMVPGAAERFLKIAEAETVHRRALEMEQMSLTAKTTSANVSMAARGQIFAFIIKTAGKPSRSGLG